MPSSAVCPISKSKSLPNADVDAKTECATQEISVAVLVLLIAVASLGLIFYCWAGRSSKGLESFLKNDKVVLKLTLTVIDVISDVLFLDKLYNEKCVTVSFPRSKFLNLQFRCSGGHSFDFWIVLGGLLLSVCAASYFLLGVYKQEFDSPEVITWFEHNSFMVSVISLSCFLSLDNFTTFRSNIFGKYALFCV